MVAEQQTGQSWHSEKLAWIRQNGSDHLRQATEEGFNVTGIYVRERAALEFPGFTYLSVAPETAFRANPSAAGLDLFFRTQRRADGYEVNLVWLSSRRPRPAGDSQEGLGQLHGEAVIVYGYLGRSGTALVQLTDSVRALAQACAVIGDLVSHGMRIREAFALAADTVDVLRVRHALQRAAGRIHEDQSARAVLAEEPHVFPRYLREMLGCGLTHGEHAWPFLAFARRYAA
jgi:hypothetical protein